MTGRELVNALRAATVAAQEHAFRRQWGYVRFFWAIELAAYLKSERRTVEGIPPGVGRSPTANTLVEDLPDLLDAALTLAVTAAPARSSDTASRLNHRYIHADGVGFLCVLTVTAPGRPLRCIVTEFWPTTEQARQQAHDQLAESDALLARRRLDESRHYEARALSDLLAAGASA